MSSVRMAKRHIRGYRRRTVQKGSSGHLLGHECMDEESYKVLDEIANVETGAQDRPVEDVVIETIEVVD